MSEGFAHQSYWENRLRDAYDLAGVGYHRLGRRYNTWMYRIRGEVFDRVAAALEVDWPTASVLDIGAGTGFYVDRWHRLGVRQVTGADLTSVAVERLQSRWPDDRFVQLDIGSTAPLPLTGERFTIVSAFDVLFHIVDDDAYAQAFTNIAALVKPGGWFLWSDNFLRHHTDRVTHQVSRPLSESASLVRKAGFEIVDRVPMFVLMNYPADSRSRVLKWVWTAMVSPAALSDRAGGVLGALLFPLERRLVRACAKSPSTELMICRRVRAEEEGTGTL